MQNGCVTHGSKTIKIINMNLLSRRRGQTTRERSLLPSINCASPSLLPRLPHYLLLHAVLPLNSCTLDRIQSSSKTASAISFVTCGTCGCKDRKTILATKSGFFQSKLIFYLNLENPGNSLISSHLEREVLVFRHPPGNKSANKKYFHFIYTIL